MELDEIFEPFCDRLTEIELQRRAGKGVAARELTKYLELAQEAEQHPYPTLQHSSTHTVYFYEALTGEAAVLRASVEQGSCDRRVEKTELPVTRRQ